MPLADSGLYDISNPCGIEHYDTFSSPQLHAQCDMAADGGGWLVIQKRINGSVDFYRDWNDYVLGFGDLKGEFWYGLENIHCLTTREDVELRVELGNGTTPSIVWTYQQFEVGGASTDYTLTIGGGQGEGGSTDSMAYSNNRRFSTMDNDNDGASGNCATSYGAGWWYYNCANANLNGPYEQQTPGNAATTLAWYDGSSYVHFTNVQMKIRPKNCLPTIEECG